MCNMKFAGIFLTFTLWTPSQVVKRRDRETEAQPETNFPDFWKFISLRFGLRFTNSETETETDHMGGTSIRVDGRKKDLTRDFKKPKGMRSSHFPKDTVPGAVGAKYN